MPDPTPEQIRAEYLLIQSGWSNAERWRRMREDQRPNGWLPPGARNGHGLRITPIRDAEPLPVDVG